MSRHALLTKAQIPLRLMPLGGSITYGRGSSDGNGYRKCLRQLLVSDGYEVGMVGSRKTGSMENNDHEGWRGFRIEQIVKKAAKSVPRLLPNVFTVNAGANDCLQDFELDHAEERISQLLEQLWRTSPGSTILLSTLLVNASESAEARILHVNEQLLNLAERQLAEDRRIVVVEMHGADGPQLCDLTVDGTHPNDAGYEKMAMKWHEGIREAFSNGFVQWPHPLP